MSEIQDEKQNIIVDNNVSKDNIVVDENVRVVEEQQQQQQQSNSEVQKEEEEKVESNENSKIKSNKFNKDDYERLITDPITISIMEDAVISTCGHSFDRNSIEGWLKRQPNCPLCKKPLTIKDLTPNYTLRELIQQFDKLQEIELENDDPSKRVIDSKEQQEIASQISSMLDQLTVLSSKINPNNNNNNNINSSSNNNVNTNVNILPKPKKDIVIRELLENECSLAAKLMETSCHNDVYWKKSGGEWYCEKMLSYAVKRARVWGLFYKNSASESRKLSGLMICQPPGQIGVSVMEMVKVGFAAAPLKMGMGPLSRVLAMFDLSEKTHQQLTRDTPHWYINCICIDPQFQNQTIGTELIDTVIKLADSQKVAIYTDTASLSSLRFFDRLGFKVLRHVSPSFCPFWALMRYPQSE
ncbi:hypothetical protein PPL_06137 [Heterostelium album PN500]|uniref:U-box domain-containing protein n=1 Tax=Heterostelium pallidum (strain ATCC 26659 / Pp 5 / PN500) TaxID=670386 RepID=D3BCB2_HETP5|nr:hypothetical protein PPL_06137 [Heterostelium album PN500]EFA80902.1 hypothetical protein PPL_06137 [Heterostelium album PN500]|eukprot:XP_020433020.1 hypothetical protein PPL_06137 [Heterostelium album PN500]